MENKNEGNENKTILGDFNYHCIKSVRDWSYSGPYSVQMWENMDQNNSEYGHLSRSVYYG